MATEVFMGLVILIVSCSLMLSSLNGETDINSFGDGLWYCFAIVTTIGFGDITAHTYIGRI
ncbi:MAG: potassium channel family protein, partial [Ruminococcus sp.]|nr:potassium channel family protein [Ruminococcus sp.]